MNKILKTTIIFFSFFLGFGLYDPFGTNGLYFDFLTLLSILLIGTQTQVLSKSHYFRKELFLLFGIALIIFIADVTYGYTYAERWETHIKYIAAVIIFWFFSFVFMKDRRLAIYSLLAFSLSCAMIALVYSLGGFSGVSEISRNGRLIIFGENPNSVSTRMAASFIIVLYFVINNPLQLNRLRYLLLLSIPSLFSFVVLSGSRGSFLAMIGGAFILVLLSNIKTSYKMILGIMTVIGIMFSLVYITESTLIDRFQQDNILESRTNIWGDALEIFYDNPLGVGHGGYLNEMNIRYSYGHDTHNLFVQLPIIGGAFSLLFYLLFLLGLTKKSFKKLLQKEALHMVLLFFMLFIMAKTGGVITYLIMWYFLALINATQYSISKRKITT